MSNLPSLTVLLLSDCVVKAPSLNERGSLNPDVLVSRSTGVELQHLGSASFWRAGELGREGCVIRLHKETYTAWSRAQSAN